MSQEESDEFGSLHEPANGWGMGPHDEWMERSSLRFNEAAKIATPTVAVLTVVILTVPIFTVPILTMPVLTVPILTVAVLTVATLTSLWLCSLWPYLHQRGG